jgi:choline kinase
MRMIILAAGQGTRLAPLTVNRPKCLVELQGRPLLDWTLAAARTAGIHDVVVIGGHCIDRLRGYDVTLVENPEYATTNMVRTLFRAAELFGDGFVMSYGDIAYAPGVLDALLRSPDDTCVAVDRDWRGYWERRFDDPLSDAESLRIADGKRLVSIGQRPASLDEIEAQYIGLAAFRGEGVEALREAYRQAATDDAAGRPPFGGLRSLDRLYMTDLLQGMIDMGFPVAAVPIRGGWVEIDSRRDLDLAEELVAAGRLAKPAEGRRQ